MSAYQVYIDLFSTLDEALSESLQNDCTKHDVGITIIAVRVTKVMKHFKSYTSVHSRLLVTQNVFPLLHAAQDT